MYKVGICDDMPELCSILQEQLENGNYTEEHLDISIYHSAQEILDASPQLDILFLDIEMPGMSGMELMEHYGYLFEDTKVVFLTSHSQYVYDGYKVKAFRFLRKPAEDSRLQEIFRTLDKEAVLNPSLTFPTPNATNIQVRLKDIMYIESHMNYSSVVTTKGTWKCRISLKDIIPQLPEAFFYCPHRAYVVNMLYVLFVYRKERRIHMSNDDYVDISFRKVNDCIDFFMKFNCR